MHIKLFLTEVLLQTVEAVDVSLDVVHPGEDCPGPHVHSLALSLQLTEHLLRLPHQLGHLPDQQGEGRVGHHLQLVLRLVRDEVTRVAGGSHDPAILLCHNMELYRML